MKTIKFAILVVLSSVFFGFSQFAKDIKKEGYPWIQLICLTAVITLCFEAIRGLFECYKSFVLWLENREMARKYNEYKD